MEITINYLLQRINSALNYPSATVEDVLYFLDQSMSELNTTLHIQLPTFSEIINDYRQKLATQGKDSSVLLTEPEIGLHITVIADESLPPVNTSLRYFYFLKNHTFYILRRNEYIPVRELFGVIYETARKFKAVVYSEDTIIWTETNFNPLFAVVSDYLPEDWLLLFTIPYTCAKYSIREGGTAAMFTEEFTQGFQQLQNAYNVPSKVLLQNVAGLPAYTNIVQKYLPRLHVEVPVRAITLGMLRDRTSIVGSAPNHDAGGFGL